VPSIPADWPGFYNHSSAARIAACGTVFPGKVTEEVRCPGVIHRLSHPIQVDVPLENGLWANEAKMVSILGSGRTRAEAPCSFCEAFAVLWEKIKRSSDENLMADALSVKRALRKTVKAIEPA
jgi:hypothetical protein